MDEYLPHAVLALYPQVEKMLARRLQFDGVAHGAFQPNFFFFFLRQQFITRCSIAVRGYYTNTGAGILRKI